MMGYNPRNPPHSIPIEKKEMILAVAKMQNNNAWRYPLSYVAALFDVTPVYVHKIVGPRRVRGVKHVWNSTQYPFYRQTLD